MRRDFTQEAGQRGITSKLKPKASTTNKIVVRDGRMSTAHLERRTAVNSDVNTCGLEMGGKSVGM